MDTTMTAEARNETSPDLEIERLLAAAYAFEVPGGLGHAVRARVREGHGSGMERRLDRRFGRPRRLALLGIGLLVAACATTASGIALLEGYGPGPSDPTRVLGTAYSETSEAAGWRLTLVQAYADANEVAAYVLVEAAGRPGESTFVSTGSVALTDEAGRVYPAHGSGHGWLADDRSANILYFAPPGERIPLGPHRFRLRVDDLAVQSPFGPDASHDPAGPSGIWATVSGPWQFEFGLDAHDGDVLAPGVSDGHDGVTLTLDRLVTSPDMIRAWITIKDAPADVAWMPTAQVSHGETTWQLMGVSAIEGDGARTVTLESQEAGLVDASGAWSVVVPSLTEWDVESDTATHQLVGPWDLSFGTEARPSTTS